MAVGDPHRHTGHPRHRQDHAAVEADVAVDDVVAADPAAQLEGVARALPRHRADLDGAAEAADLLVELAGPVAMDKEVEVDPPAIDPPVQVHKPGFGAADP